MMPYIKFKGKDVYYETHGQGDTIVLLHHGFSSGLMWEHIYPKFIENGFKVLLYDRRGYGRSEEGEDFFEFFAGDNFRSHSVEELAALAEHLKIDSCHVIGQCEGGVIGLDFAARYQEKVKSVVLGGTQCYSERPMVHVNRDMFPPAFDQLDPDFREKMIYWHGARKAEAFYNRGIETSGGAYGTGIFDMRPELPRIVCPVLVLYPDRSVFFSVEQGVAYYRGLPQAELAVIPRCGHHTYEEVPDEYCRQVLGFYARYNAG